jgi:AAA domain, putative AbiEii toxin, Type IV TA system
VSRKLGAIHSSPKNSYSTVDQVPSHPIQMLYLNDKLEHRLSSHFKRAFGKDLILHRGGGSHLPLLVGFSPELETGESIFTKSYDLRLRKNTEALDNQGDGMRSFASVILQALAPTTIPSVLLLDEPEAFLHPPQAKLVGEIVAMEKPKNSQLFVATHSLEVLQGMLASTPNNLRVIRLQREGNINRVCELDKSKAKAIAADPILKHSMVMSGLFHERVIVCESDADCMFYSSILDLPKVRGETQPDVLFTYASGKQRITILVDALKSLDVKVDAILDIDVLSNLEDMKKIIEALKGNWTEIEALALPVKQAIESKKPGLDADEVVSKIKKIINGSSGKKEFPKPKKLEIESLLRKASPWEAIKSAGVAAIPKGQPIKQFQELCKRCSQLGLWIVPEGELEGFCRSEGNHGPKWVQNVLSKYDIETDSNLSEAREFVRSIWTRNPMYSQTI